MMKRNPLLRLPATFLFALLSAAAQAQTFALDALPAGATLQGVVASADEVGGRKALRVALSDEVVRAGFGPGGYGDEPTYLAIPADFGNGSIEVDLMGRLGPRAPRDSRAFIGVVFRTAADHKSFESIYLRPTNGRKRDPGAPRNVRAIQYFAYPDWKFDRLRRDFPDGRYESGADIADGEWIRLRLEVDGAVVRTFINDKPELVVSDLRLGATRRGALGLFVDIGTEGYFANLKITPR
jgi:hypothetical protein